MTRSSNFIILAPVLIIMMASVALIGKHKVFKFKKTETMLVKIHNNQEQKGQAMPLVPDEPEKKMHSPKTEELAHVHHFHKERVKKLKRHHNKFWIMSKILLAICHLLILALAFIHLTQ